MLVCSAETALCASATILLCELAKTLVAILKLKSLYKQFFRPYSSGLFGKSFQPFEVSLSSLISLRILVGQIPTHLVLMPPEPGFLGPLESLMH